MCSKIEPVCLLPLALSGGSTNTCTGVRVCQPARTRKIEVAVVSMPAVRMLSLPSAAFVRVCLRVLHNPRCQLSRHYQRRDGAARTQTVPNGATLTATIDGRGNSQAIYASFVAARVSDRSWRRRFEFQDLLGAVVEELLAWTLLQPLPAPSDNVLGNVG